MVPFCYNYLKITGRYLFVEIIVILGILVFSIVMFTLTSIQRANGNLKGMKKEEGFICGGILKHTIGLPIAEGVNCKVLYFKDRLEIRFNNMKFLLDINKILDICLKTDKEIQSQYVSSAGGAVGGALLFGPVGALIGGRTKEKKITKTTTYLIITYEDNGVKYMGFDVKDLITCANKFVYTFRNSNTNYSNYINLNSLPESANLNESKNENEQGIISQPSESGQDTITQIERFFELKEKGIITEEEFDVKKKQFLEIEKNI